VRLIARFLQENTRNTRRWLARAHERSLERDSVAGWLDCKSLLREWVRESGALSYPLLQRTQEILLGILLSLQSEHGIGRCAALMGASKPTYSKKMGEYQRAHNDNRPKDAG